MFGGALAGSPNLSRHAQLPRSTGTGQSASKIKPHNQKNAVFRTALDVAGGIGGGGGGN